MLPVRPSVFFVPTVSVSSCSVPSTSIAGGSYSSARSLVTILPPVRRVVRLPPPPTPPSSPRASTGGHRHGRHRPRAYTRPGSEPRTRPPEPAVGPPPPRD